MKSFLSLALFLFWTVSLAAQSTYSITASVNYVPFSNSGNIVNHDWHQGGLSFSGENAYLGFAVHKNKIGVEYNYGRLLMYASPWASLVRSYNAEYRELSSSNRSGATYRASESMNQYAFSNHNLNLSYYINLGKSDNWRLNLTAGYGRLIPKDTPVHRKQMYLVSYTIPEIGLEQTHSGEYTKGGYFSGSTELEFRVFSEMSLVLGGEVYSGKFRRTNSSITVNNGIMTNSTESIDLDFFSIGVKLGINYRVEL